MTNKKDIITLKINKKRIWAFTWKVLILALIILFVTKMLIANNIDNRLESIGDAQNSTIELIEMKVESVQMGFRTPQKGLEELNDIEEQLDRYKVTIYELDAKRRGELSHHTKLRDWNLRLKLNLARINMFAVEIYGVGHETTYEEYILLREFLIEEGYGHLYETPEYPSIFKDELK